MEYHFELMKSWKLNCNYSWTPVKLGWHSCGTCLTFQSQSVSHLNFQLCFHPLKLLLAFRRQGVSRIHMGSPSLCWYASIGETGTLGEQQTRNSHPILGYTPRGMRARHLCYSQFLFVKETGWICVIWYSYDELPLCPSFSLCV